MRGIALVFVFLIGCSKQADAPTTCTCTPGNTGRIRGAGGSEPLTGSSLLAALRKHAQDVRLGKNPRDIKVADDQLRFQIIDYCSPCEAWVDDRMTMEEMFPLDRLDDATGAVCMGLVLKDGSTVYGGTRPAVCR
jgi:hypothetical protein